MGVGAGVKLNVGAAEITLEGTLVGEEVASAVGSCEGDCEGASEGFEVRAAVAISVYRAVGAGV